MSATTVSTKFQVVIPKDVRERIHLKPGTRLEVFVDGGVIRLVPVRPLKDLYGILKGADIGEVRDHSERYE